MTATPLPREAVAHAVRAALATMVLEEEPDGPYAVNDGRCEDLALDALRLLGRRDGEGIWIFETGSLTDGFGGPFDVALISREFADTVPPAPLDWSDMDDLGMGGTAHIWLFADGRHHDCDAPEGVANLFDLPLMRRNLVAVVRHERPEAEAELKTLDWWRESFAMHDDFLAWRAARTVEAGSPGP